MSNRVRYIPEDLLDILEELVIYEDGIEKEESRPYLELEYLEDGIEDFCIRIEPEEEEQNIIHIQL